MEKTYIIDIIRAPFERFTRIQAGSSFLLIACTILAFIAANSSFADAYTHFWHEIGTIELLSPHLPGGGISLSYSYSHWINDGLMAIFFFVVGLEIKRELLIGELSSLKKASLPIFGALGGIVVPALLFFSLNQGNDSASGWGIPMATDIAFAVGIVTLLGKRVHPALKIFLMALAIVDDIGAVLVIAFFYTATINWSVLLIAFALIGLLIMGNISGVRSLLFYSLVGIFVWLLFLQSGVHATIAGVLVALTIPAKPRIDPVKYAKKTRKLLTTFDEENTAAPSNHANEHAQELVHEIEKLSENVQTPLSRFEHALHKEVAFIIMPLFALANAGVQISSGSFASLVEPLPLGIILGLCIGKPLGITLFAWFGSKMKLATLPSNVGWRDLFLISILGGVGFTMSLFITNLAFRDQVMIDEAKLGILLASLVSGVVGYLLLSRKRIKT